MNTDNFNRNIRRLIKKNGYKLSTFGKEVLDIEYQTFNLQLKKGTLALNNVITMLDLFQIELSQLASSTPFQAKKVETVIKPVQHGSKESVLKIKPKQSAKRVTKKHDLGSIM